MKCSFPLHLGAALAAAGAIGGGIASVLGGSMILLVIAGLCALICGLLVAIALQRSAATRLDALHRLLSADLATATPGNDNRGRC